LDLQSTILSGLIPRTQSEKPETDAALTEAIQLKLTSNHFTGMYRFLFEVIGSQAAKASILDREILETYLSSSTFTDEQKTQARILFASCREQTVEVDKLRTIIPAFIEQQGEKEFGAILTDTAKILTEGLRVGRSDLKGFDAARQFLIRHVTSIASATVGNSPQGPIAGSMDSFWDNYFQARSNPDFGIKSGIQELDAATGGARPGELFTVAGFAKEGKSQVLRNWAYNAAVRHHKNVVYASLEMPKDQLMDVFVSLHSTHEKFKNTDGIRAFDISDGKLTPAEEVSLKIVTDDWTNNPDYGILYILQMPSGSTVSSIQSQLAYIQSMFPIDALFLDYASLLNAETSMPTTTMQVTSIYKALKQMAITFNDGKGLPIISAHQTSRAKREAVDKSENKRYDMGYLSDAAEVERSSDMVSWILRTDDLVTEREIKMGISYFRRGRIPMDWRCREYYDCSKIGSLGPVAASFGSPTSTPSLGKLTEDIDL